MSEFFSLTRLFAIHCASGATPCAYSSRLHPLATIPWQ